MLSTFQTGYKLKPYVCDIISPFLHKCHKTQAVLVGAIIYGLDKNPTEVCFYTGTPLVKSEQDNAHAKRRDIMIQTMIIHITLLPLTKNPFLGLFKPFLRFLYLQYMSAATQFYSFLSHLKDIQYLTAQFANKRTCKTLYILLVLSIY